MTPIELVTATDGFLEAHGIDADQHTYMTADDARALELQCRRDGLIRD